MGIFRIGTQVSCGFGASHCSKSGILGLADRVSTHWRYDVFNHFAGKGRATQNGGQTVGSPIIKMSPVSILARSEVF